MATPEPGEPGAPSPPTARRKAVDALDHEGHGLLRQGEGLLQAAALDDAAAEVDQERVERAAAELDPDRVRPARVEAENGRGLAARAAALAVGADRALALELADDLAGGVVRELGVPGEIGLRGRAQPTQQGEDHPLVELAYLDRVAALTDAPLRTVDLPCCAAASRDDHEPDMSTRASPPVNN